MGQATLELPDPLSQSDIDSPADADELLSQLAGDEIDRMLADADVSTRENSDPAESPALDSSMEASPDQGLDDPHSAILHPADPEGDELFQSDGLAFSSPDLTAPEIQAQLSSELDQLFDTINNHEESPPDEQAPAPSATAAHDSPNADEPTILPSAVTQEQDEAAATAALLESIEPTTATAPLPIWLRPLEWLNAPLASLTDSARSALGKAAIITLFNAIVILLYVLLFRK